jgi:DNA-binding response OmpR family regulator
VLAADDAEVAVQLFAADRERIDLVVLDANLPKMPSTQAYHLMHELKPGVPVLFFVANSAERLSIRTQLGAGPHIVRKPFGPAELTWGVRRAMDNRQATPTPSDRVLESSPTIALHA